MGDAQLEWLEKQLKDAADNNYRVIIMTHVPIAPGKKPNASLTHEGGIHSHYLRPSPSGAQSRICGTMCILWNFKEVLEVLHKNADAVGAVLSGHDHQGGYKKYQGIHHVTLEAVIETSVG